MKKNICIICREKNDLMSDEHVIPDALGGYYHIYSICKDCNSLLGTNVDSKLTNHKFAEFQRYNLGLKGKSKKLPNPFSGTHKLKQDLDRQVQLRINEDGKPTPYVLPKVEYQNHEDGSTTINICLDATDESKLSGIIEKISKKLHIPKTKCDFSNREPQFITRPTIQGSFSIDLKEFKIGLLKIAYEFAIDTIPAYFDDDSSIEIANTLKMSDYSAAEKYVNIGDGFNKEILSPISKIVDFEKPRHILFLTSTKKSGLICIINLNKMFSVGVTLSDKKYPEDIFTIGINDLQEKSFRKFHAKEIQERLYGQRSLRFQYFFNDPASLRFFQSIQLREDFEILTQADEIPLFNESGKSLGLTLRDAMIEVENSITEEEISFKSLFLTYTLQKNFYVKIIPTDNLIQIIAVREEYQWQGKL